MSMRQSLAARSHTLTKLILGGPALAAQSTIDDKSIALIDLKLTWDDQTFESTAIESHHKPRFRTLASTIRATPLASSGNLVPGLYWRSSLNSQKEIGHENSLQPVDADARAWCLNGPGSNFLQRFGLRHRFF